MTSEAKSMFNAPLTSRVATNSSRRRTNKPTAEGKEQAARRRKIEEYHDNRSYIRANGLLAS